MAIAIDAMGGDHAPAEIVRGALAAARHLTGTLTLTGESERLREELRRLHASDSLIAVEHASQLVTMDESPGAAVRHKPDSSIAVAMRLVAEGRAEAVVTAGNSGAAMAEAVTKLGTASGTERPAIASIMPSLGGRVILLDVGANVDCKPRHLLDFARMGSVYAHRVLGIERPRVGLLSIGEEAAKGNDVTKAAYPLLAESGLNFVGNIEGRDAFAGAVDVAVCDGFVGNVGLKLGEGLADVFSHVLREELSRGLAARFGAWVARGALRRFGKRLDYAEYGGALLLGVRGICVIAHGRSNARAIAKAIRLAHESAAHGVVEGLEDSLASTSPTPVALGREG
ncbi:phosphate acyltransferase [candidate division KD3-62 bacterium DG_56]|uniref:Phosphate acyltransferase n=1 Tax=candidate division KD3-62 bacterium DG_56 TaxID=1704032 RepID=A0A0S7XN68_9BACT|nr:MAG: phosphate acyltransferase [candidate division KD3-62 bacterium DG_56]